MGTGSLTVGFASMVDPTISYNPGSILLGGIIGGAPVGDGGQILLTSLYLGLNFLDSQAANNNCQTGMVCSNQNNGQPANMNTNTNTCPIGLMSCSSQTDGQAGSTKDNSASGATQSDSDTTNSANGNWTDF